MHTGDFPSALVMIAKDGEYYLALDFPVARHVTVIQHQSVLTSENRFSPHYDLAVPALNEFKTYPVAVYPTLHGQITTRLLGSKLCAQLGWPTEKDQSQPALSLRQMHMRRVLVVPR